MVNSPIWKDTFYSASTSALTYYVTVDGITIFNGRAFARPSTNNILININKICQNYLSNELPDFREFTTSAVTNQEACKVFSLYNTNGTLLEQYRFLYDWSYSDEATFTGNYIMSRPINGHYATGMFVFNTVFDGTVVTNNISKTNGSYCGDYAIYYLNGYGGWDSYLFEGKARKYDGFSQYEYNRVFNNNSIEFEENRYISEVKGEYELSTGLLTDEEADNFAFNLVGSNACYLHNLKTDKIFPVVIDESNIEYKKYVNDRRMIEYTIRVKDSQNKIRK